MTYKGVEYQILRVDDPPGWKWTVFLEGSHKLSGIAATRAHAVLDAERTIDKAVRLQD
jgi:hypothetical protein